MSETQELTYSDVSEHSSKKVRYSYSREFEENHAQLLTLAHFGVLGSLPRSPRQSLQRLYLCRRASVCSQLPSPPPQPIRLLGEAPTHHISYSP